MSVDPTKLAALLARLKTGKPFVASYLKVEWASGTKYYGTTAYADISPFRGIKQYTGGQQIEPRIKGNPFLAFEINGDLRTENIPIEFDDSLMLGVSAAGVIKAAFEANDGAPKTSIFFYYPQEDLNHSPWWGQLLPPQIVGRFTQKCVLTNGYKSAERFIPNGTAPRECPAQFSGTLDTLDKIATNLCGPYDRHLGGSVGLLDAAGQPFKNCPKTKEGCTARFGHTRYHAGLDTNVTSIQSDNHPGNLAISHSSQSIRNKPKAWIFGTKHIRDMDVLLWAKLPNPNDPDHAWIRVLWRVGERVHSISNLKINDKFQTLNQEWAYRLGERGQAGGYPGIESETFSGTSLVYDVFGYVTPSDTPQTLNAECDVVGYPLVAVFSDEDTFTRVFSDDRIWCTAEMYTNQTAGLTYELGTFNIADCLTASVWGRKTVTFKFTGVDGEERTFSGRRTTFDCRVEGRPAVEVIQDVCRSGRISMPFQDAGKYTIKPFAVFTQDELDNAVVFADHGADQNIFTPQDGSEAVVFTRTLDDKVTNEIGLTFEESNNFDIARTIFGNDPDQQARASKILGDEAFSVVPKQFAAFGVRQEQEAVRLLYSLLWFGEFETGGTKNNCFQSFFVPYLWALAIERYGVFKLDLVGQEIPKGPTGQAQVMTATAVGTATASGNITVTVTAAGLSGSPVAVTVPILNHDTPAMWAPKVVTALKANAAISAFFFPRGSGISIPLTARNRAANDATFNIAIAAGSTGITAAPTSTATTAGVADGAFEWFRCQSIKKLDNDWAEIKGVAYNRLAMESFEVESGGGGTGGVCSIDADCDPGYECVGGLCVPMQGGECSITADCDAGFVCRNGVCVPIGVAEGCDPGIAGVSYNELTGIFSVTIDDC